MIDEAGDAERIQREFAGRSTVQALILVLGRFSSVLGAVPLWPLPIAGGSRFIGEGHYT